MSFNNETLDLVINNVTAHLPVVNKDGSYFFNATQLWKLNGADESQKPVQYLRSERGQRFIFQRYTEVKSEGGLSPVLNTGFNYQYHIALPKEITENFISTIRGRNASTWMESSVFLHYAQTLSAALESQVISCFQRFGIIHNAPLEEQTELLIEEAKATEGRLMEQQIQSSFSELNDAQQKAFTHWRMCRLDSKVSTSNLQEILALYYGADEYQLGGVFNQVFGTLLSTLFSQHSKSLASDLGVAEFKRDMLTPVALRAITHAQNMFLQHLEDASEDGEMPQMRELPSIMGQYAVAARDTILYRNGSKDSRLVAENVKRNKSKNGLPGVYQIEARSNEPNRKSYTPF